MATTTDAFTEGYEACIGLGELPDCPYPIMSRDAIEWCRGFDKHWQEFAEEAGVK